MQASPMAGEQTLSFQKITQMRLGLGNAEGSLSYGTIGTAVVRCENEMHPKAHILGPCSEISSFINLLEDFHQG